MSSRTLPIVQEESITSSSSLILLLQSLKKSYEGYLRHVVQLPLCPAPAHKNAPRIPSSGESCPAGLQLCQLAAP